jgi:predicted nucleotidyltransferase
VQTGSPSEALLRGDGVTYLARDFLETREGLLFAVIANGHESQRVLGFLRYVRRETGLCKLGTDDANRCIERHFPEYGFHSPRRDALVHGVPLSRIVRHYRPTERLAEIISQPPGDEILDKARSLAGILGSPVRIDAPPGTDATLETDAPSRIDAPCGVTGSMLVGAQGPRSDIDFVFYGSAEFTVARDRMRSAMESGEVKQLNESMWCDAYRRRGCSLTFEEYLWHEKRKFNKCSLEGTKVDISCVNREAPDAGGSCEKLRLAVIRGVVVDASRSFEYPARYDIDHSDIREVVSFTPTYSGQALTGETIEASGWIERPERGKLRLAVGTSREATGEYIKVLHL